VDADHEAVRVLVPWDLTSEFGPWPAGLGVGVYDGAAEPPAGADLSTVGMYVVPYARPRAIPLIEEMPALEVVQVITAGYETVLPLIRPGVTLSNGRGLHDASTAEHALALILAAQRDLPQWFGQQVERRWKSHFTRSLADSRVVIVGYGSIGQALGRRLTAAEATVVGVASKARPEVDGHGGVHGVDELPELLPRADIVVLVLPDTPGTRGLFGAELLGRLPDGALVVNVGRGGAIDTDALHAETATGRLRAALDVTSPEPLPADHPLWTDPGVIITPHVAGGSATFYPRARRFVAEQVRRWAAGQPLHNVVTTG
jgi:phosphoglycerate dehydrogenase-like enzyme